MVASRADPTPAKPPESRPAPGSPRELFVAFTWLALQGFGGVMAIVQREMVERRGWLTPDEFLEDWAVAQLLPGPNVINLALMIGERHFGWRGSVAAVGGMLALPLALILVLAVAYAKFGDRPQVAGALRGMSAVAGGLIAATGFKLLPALRRHVMGFVPCLVFVASVFVAVSVLRLPLMAVLFGVGGLACALTWRRLRAHDAQAASRTPPAP